VDEIVREIIIVFIFSLTLILGGILLFIFSRRLYRKRRFAKLDRLREIYTQAFDNFIKNKLSAEKTFSPPKNSLYREALEDVLLDGLEKGYSRDELYPIFEKFGYVNFYEKSLKSRSTIKKCIAIDRLGKIKSERSVDKLIPLLKDKNSEVVSTTLLALSNIGSEKALRGILENLSSIYESKLAAVKTIKTSLIKFSPNFLPHLLEYTNKSRDNPQLLAIILDVLSNFENASLVNMALDYLNHKDVEVRAQALKILERNAKYLDEKSIDKLLEISDDSAWFVRLRLLYIFDRIKRKNTIPAIEKLIYDKVWQVRDAAARVLVGFREDALDSIIRVLNSEDRYAKDSIYEALQKSGYIETIRENLNSTNLNIREKCRIISEKIYSVCRLGFERELVEEKESISHCEAFKN